MQSMIQYRFVGKSVTSRKIKKNSNTKTTADRSKGMSKKKTTKKDVLTVDTVKCSSKNTIVIHKKAPKSVVKLSGKRYNESLASFKKDGLSAEERLLCAVFGDSKCKGLPIEQRTKKEHDKMYVRTEKMFQQHDSIEKRFNNGRRLVLLSDKEKKKVESLRKKGFAIKAIAKEIHRSDHTVREFLNGSSQMSIADMEKALKKGIRPAYIQKVAKKKK